MLVIQELELVWPAMKFESIDEHNDFGTFPRTKEITAWVAFRGDGMLVIHVSRIDMRWLSCVNENQGLERMRSFSDKGRSTDGVPRTG
jgi:hypothetical protein